METEVGMKPDIGIGLFILATAISFVCGAVQLNLHRQVHAVFCADDEPTQTVLEATASLDGEARSDPSLVVRLPTAAAAAGLSAQAICDVHFQHLFCWRDCELPRSVRAMVPSLLALCAVGIVVGCCITSYTINVEGVAGSLMGNASSTDWSVLSVSLRLGDISERAPPFFMRTLQARAQTRSSLPSSFSVDSLAAQTRRLASS